MQVKSKGHFENQEKYKQESMSKSLQKPHCYDEFDTFQITTEPKQ